MNKPIGVDSPEDLKKKTAKPWCSHCGVDQSPTRDPQLLARMRFEHHHDCQEHPKMQWERTKALLQAATLIYVAPGWEIDTAVDVATKLLAEIERRNLGSDELINTSPEKLRENGGRKA